MNKREYLFELEKALKAAQIRDSAEILEEYAVHFDMKLIDGYSEEEIAAKLATPASIAGQFGELTTAGGREKAGEVFLRAGLVIADIFAVSFFIVLYAWVAVLAAFTIASAGLGMASIAGNRMFDIIPQMPYICALLLGLALLALAVLSAAGTEYCRLYVTQILRVYARWHGGIWGRPDASPPLTLHPRLSPKKRRIMRGVALISVAVVAACFTAGYISMALAAGSVEPWHVWHWFE